MRTSVFCLLTALLVGCHPVTVGERLNGIRELVWTYPDSALTLLETIPPPPTDAEELALYGLLQAQLYYRTSRPLPNLDTIRYAVRYYESRDTRHPFLPEALLSLGLSQLETGQTDSAVHNLNRAAALANPESDPRPLSQLYSTLALTARTSGNYRAAHYHYGLSQKYSARSGRPDWIWNNAVSMLNTPHYLMDSVAGAALTDTILDYLPQVTSPNLRTTALNNIGWYHEYHGHISQAEEYYRRAIGEGDGLMPKAWLNLTSLLERVGREKESDSLLAKAVLTENAAFRTEMHRLLATRAIRRGKTVQALEHLSRYGKGLRDFYAVLHDDNLAAIQQRYDLVATENRHLKRYRTLQMTFGAIIGSIFCIGMLYRHHHRHRLSLMKRKMDQLYRKLDDSLTTNEEQRKSLLKEADRMTAELARKDALLRRWQVIFGTSGSECRLEPEDVRALAFYIRLRYLQSPVSLADEVDLTRWLDLTENGFATRLKDGLPMLAPTERMTVLLVRMGMGIDALSCAFDRSTQTIRQRIYRICTKMGCPQDVKHFLSFIHEF